MSELLFVVDYDGTLARENEKADPSIVESLSSLKQRSGFKLALATARPLSDIEAFVPLSVFDAMVLELGSVVYLSSREVVFKPRVWGRILERISREVPSVNRGEVLYYFDQDSLKVAEKVASGLGEAPLELKKVGSRTYVFAPKGLDKGVGLARLLRLTGWSGIRVVAIGDSASDLPLFQQAWTRVAVANADEKVKEAADLVTNGEYGNGVIEAVRKIVGKKQLKFSSLSEDAQQRKYEGY
ncbi:HAD family hydrolase [Infirmifilum sp. NZ]|uniref:HAD family hydrolase n=1 Tax=Infirmifilum sp. NZ TaxID=2926850 RepID=UPI0027A48D63|nr:HAD family hydrolase [Infirmifilum sp. NZ]UNQ73207.1 Cof-type HAD-IIB family hydrolase [Infirmifilum sp. NZ]